MVPEAEQDPHFRDMCWMRTRGVGTANRNAQASTRFRRASCLSSHVCIGISAQQYVQGLIHDPASFTAFHLQ